jgi:hypothetical protein
VVFSEPFDLGGDAERDGAGLLVLDRHGPVDIHNVGVRTESDLTAAEPAHTDHGELDTVAASGGGRLPHHRDDAGEKHGRDVGEPACEFVDGDDAQDGRDGETEDLSSS